MLHLHHASCSATQNVHCEAVTSRISPFETKEGYRHRCLRACRWGCRHLYSVGWSGRATVGCRAALPHPRKGGSCQRDAAQPRHRVVEVVVAVAFVALAAFSAGLVRVRAIALHCSCTVGLMVRNPFPEHLAGRHDATTRISQ